ncbi:hypothetical protein EYF80_007136 [Liparis tanakae]|uniref:Uncharacterized protein n=1 Tax=Liparis tanakae TaxID=230148 RepID=A0A4Z2IYP4_9TELE|nr:hypothetical protein EYF80_007136 [Liparis tanakae]
MFSTHHIDELSDGQSKLDDDNVGDVGHGSGPLVVSSEQPLEELILGVRLAGWRGMRVSLLVAAGV